MRGWNRQRVRRKGHRLEATPLQHGEVQTQPELAVVWQWPEIETQLIISALMRPLLIYR